MRGRAGRELDIERTMRMNLDELKALLDAGKLTRAQYDALARALAPDKTQPEPESTPEHGDQSEQSTEDDVDRRIQSAVDRATNRLGNENKRLRAQLDDLRRSKLTAQEQAEQAMKDREDALAQREQELLAQLNRHHAIKELSRALKAEGLDDGSELVLKLADLVTGSTEEDTNQRVKLFATLVRQLVKTEVDRTFKAHGRSPAQGSAPSEANPWAKETWNITRQMQLEMADRERARQLMQAAGIS